MQGGSFLGKLYTDVSSTWHEENPIHRNAGLAEGNCPTIGAKGDDHRKHGQRHDRAAFYREIKVNLVKSLMTHCQLMT